MMAMCSIYWQGNRDDVGERQRNDVTKTRCQDILHKSESLPKDGSWSLLVIDELIGVICLKLRACSPSRNNTSIHFFTKIGHEPILVTRLCEGVRPRSPPKSSPKNLLRERMIYVESHYVNTEVREKEQGQWQPRTTSGYLRFHPKTKRGFVV
jgi:hypothetical protein